MHSNHPRREPAPHHPPHLQQHHSLQHHAYQHHTDSSRHRPCFASSSNVHARRDHRGHSEPPSSALWREKDLPALPTNYRLGEGLPWDLGAEPAADPDDLVILPYTRPTIVPIEAQPEFGRERAYRREDPLRKRNLENLSAAMMTVDNGFEGQWWNRGGRVLVESMPVESIESVEAQQTQQIQPTQPSLGWAIAEPATAMPFSPYSAYSAYTPPETSTSVRGHTFPAVPQHDFTSRTERQTERGRPDLVSPESESASIAPWSETSRTFVASNFGSVHGRPHRRRSTQSEELFLGYY